MGRIQYGRARTISWLFLRLFESRLAVVYDGRVRHLGSVSLVDGAVPQYLSESIRIVVLSRDSAGRCLGESGAGPQRLRLLFLCRIVLVGVSAISNLSLVVSTQ